jgi:hypothetical protein
MIAMLLAAQLSAALPRDAALDQSPSFNSPAVRSAFGGRAGIITRLPALATCPGAGRMEASLSQPAALYRRGDRPARMYLKWADYPDGRMCMVEVAP